MSVKFINLGETLISANTGLDAIKRAPIVDYPTSIRCLRIQDVSQSKDFHNWGYTNVDLKNYQKFQLRAGDIIVARTGNTVGVNQYINDDLSSVFNNGLIRLRINTQLFDSKFIYYNFKTPSYQGFIENISGGTSTQPNMQINALLTMEIPLFSILEQKAIASVLSSLDDKIDLLHRQNKTLESMAETLFRQWFVEEAQSDWSISTLKDEFNFVMGQSPKGTSFNEDRIGIPMYQGNADFGFRFPSQRVYTTEPTRFAEAMDTLISVRAPVGAQNMASEKCCIGRGVAAFSYKKDKGFYTYTFFKLRELMVEIKKFNDEGTVFGSISKSDFEKIEITIPPFEKILSFEQIAKPLNDKIISNCLQILKLEKLRETLLPKLMSGEVRVKYDVESSKTIKK